MKFGSLFAGIGGLDLGLERAGMKCVWQAENDPVCQAILKKRFPHTMKFGDVKIRRDYPYVDLLCGGFPCQPISGLGLRKGEDDERWLWPYFNAIIGQLLPRWVLIENVQRLRAYGLQTILESLAYSGYDAEWDCIPATSVGAPHIRFRYFVVAYKRNRSVKAKGKSRRTAKNFSDAESDGRDAVALVFRKQESREHASYQNSGTGTDAGNNCSPLAKLGKRNSLEAVGEEESIARFGWWAVEPGVVRMVHGFPHRVHRVAGLGNAVVPQVATWVGKRILAAEERDFS